MYAAPEVTSFEAQATDHQYVLETVEARTASQFVPSQKMEYELNKRMVSMGDGRLVLHLRQTLLVSLEISTFECEIVGWGIHVPQTDIGNIDRLLARRFLTLFAKADSQSLTKEEQSDWLSILDQVDYDAFCFDRSAPRYLEGKLVRHTPLCFVEWLDGTKEKISPHLSGALKFLEPGEEFGAYVQLDRDAKARSIDRVLPLVSS